MSALKKVALELHCLSTPDREWLLQRLPKDKLPDLQRLLQELGDLGIPRTPLTSTSLSQSVSSSSNVTASRAFKLLELVARVDSRLLINSLSSDSSSVRTIAGQLLELASRHAAGDKVGDSDLYGIGEAQCNIAPKARKAIVEHLERHVTSLLAQDTERKALSSKRASEAQSEPRSASLHKQPTLVEKVEL